MKTKRKFKMFLSLLSFLYSLHKIRKNQWLSPIELEKLQEDKLKALLHHAYYKVDYYRRLFDQAGIRPEDIKNVKDLAKIPITTRREFQAVPKKEITAKDVDLTRCINLRTSGSSGMPLDIFLSFRETFLRRLFYRRMYFENGGKLTDRTVSITSPQHFRNKKWFQYLGILEEKYIPVFNDIESQLKVILEFRPEIIGGFASSLKHLAIEVQKKRIKGINPRILFSTAELMTEQDRELITSVFQAELFNYYACNECGTIAWECKEHFGYHINSDDVIVEFIREDGSNTKAGEEGEIVITSLNSYAMPFIRYRLGDIGVPSDEKCPCGRTLPLMEIIKGRVNDYIILPNGKKISHYLCMMTMDKIKGVNKYQIVQEKQDKIIINVIYDRVRSSNDIAVDIIETYKHVLGQDMDIELIPVKEIAKERTDKQRVIVSKLA